MGTSEIKYKDYYKILGVSKKSSIDEIKKAFRNLARKYHPDVTKNDKELEKRFKDIFEAYEVLSDDEKKKQYDLYTEQDWNIRKATGNLNENLVNKKGSNSSFSDFFYSIFGSVKENTLKNIKKINNLEKEITITLEDAYNGVEKEVLIPIEENCKKCHGSGNINNQPCLTCKGKGILSISRAVNVKIPSGVSHDSKLSIQGEGSGSGSFKGDLILKVKIEKHKFFEIDENKDVVCEVPVTLTEAVLGADIEVPTLKNHVKMKIPPGTQPSQTFRLKNRGLYLKKEDRHTDQLIKICVVIPKELSIKERELYKELAFIDNSYPREGIF